MQDALGALWEPLGRTSWYPSAWAASLLVVFGWGYFLYIGVIDPNGGINILWPLFGMANQMLAAIALAVVTATFVKSGRQRYAWVPGLPLAWLVTVTTAAAIQKIFSDDRKWASCGGPGPCGKAGGRRAAAGAPRSHQADLQPASRRLAHGVLPAGRVDRRHRHGPGCLQHLSGRRPAHSTESPYVATQLT
jgi:hypothetical protein